jgi:hypothetical protein
MRPPLRHLTAVVLSALAVAACGGDDDEDEATTQATTGATGTTGAAGAAPSDVEAQSTARTAQTALEVYYTDNTSYAGADAAELAAIEPDLPADIEVEADAQSYTLTVPSETGNSFTIERDADGTVTHSCTEPGAGDCPESGEW